MNGDYRKYNGERCLMGCCFYSGGVRLLYGPELKFTNFYPTRCDDCLGDKFINEIEDD
jgi:hypothetical protein